MTFVRLLRVKGMKFGVAVDLAGKRWRGFFSNRSASDVYQTGHLGSVGLCMMCRGRVYEGWECLNDKRDVCTGCLVLPPTDKTFVMPADHAELWEAAQREFFRHADFDYVRWYESTHRPGEGHHQPE